MAEEVVEKNKGGRPVGSKDSKPRMRRPVKSSNPWAKKKKDKRSVTNKKLLMDHLRSYNFDVVKEILWLYDQLKGQCSIEKTEEGVEFIVYEKDISSQMLDILKTLVSHSFPKMKALELKTGQDNPITLSFTLGGEKEKKAIKVKEEEKEQAIDMVSGPGGLHLPVPSKRGKSNDLL